MGLFGRKPDMDELIAERDRLLQEVLPFLKEQVENNPNDGKIHLEYVKAVAMSGQLDDAKRECEAAMAKLSLDERQPARDLQKHIEGLIRKRDLGY